MQPKYTHNKSNIIKLTEEAKRKSRHRLIGSILLLFIALLILLNVTAKVKPIPINPEIVEVNNGIAKTAESINSGHTLNLPNQLAHNSASGIISAGSSAPLSLTTMTKSTSSPSTQNGFKAGVVDQSQISAHQDLDSNAQNNDPDQQDRLPKPTPKPKIKSKPLNPANILDGLTDDPQHEISVTTLASGSSYIQFAALSSATKAHKLQQILMTHGISTMVQAIQTPKGTLYRLRAGPYDKETAADKLQQMLDLGYTGIITGK